MLKTFQCHTNTMSMKRDITSDCKPYAIDVGKYFFGNGISIFFSREKLASFFFFMRKIAITPLCHSRNCVAEVWFPTFFWKANSVANMSGGKLRLGS